jgi:(1->4)-alpha-D-glucan 1-alpha-D-glucosylmutase
VPRATYRVQLHAGFTFDDAVAIVPYLARLGISHLYASPILQAAAGSMHGYDVVDHSRVNRELGGEEGFARLTDALRAQGMGLVVDIVPNHMAIVEGNRWWWDVLEHGRASRYAGHFDVDWDPPESRLRNVILLPILNDHYGRVLEAGDIRLVRQDGRLAVHVSHRSLPVDPRSIGALVVDAARGAASDELAGIGAALSELPPSTSADLTDIARRQRDAEDLGARLDELASDPTIARALDAAVGSVNADPDSLDALLEEQNYRLALWRAASRDLGYRRFFDIDELIGLRVEDDEVFRDTHRLVLGWLADGRVDGLRVDHPDGLRDPAGYFARLRDAAPKAWIVAEKILEGDEALPRDWPIDGTTGYRFANLAAGLLVDTAGEDALTELWVEHADAGPDWEPIAGDARAEVLSAVLGSDVNRLTDLFLAVCEANRRYRDFTRHELHHALREVAAALPVYRTYLRTRDRYRSDADLAVIDRTVATAAQRRPDLDPELFGFLRRILRLEEPGRLAGELAMRFQQLTPAAMAKGVEDTAFYRHHRLVALNEVGGDPGRFGMPVEAVHAAMAEAHERWPAAMLALSTHDTKRSGDVRARLALLAGAPDAWEDAVARLEGAAAPYRSGPEHPTDADAYLFFQIVVGAWPIDADRSAAYLEKASREAKLRTSWTDPDPEYDAALDRFVRGALGDQAFVEAVGDVVATLLAASRRAALAQLALQLTAPGVPDTYQGGELWDLSLVDPDNRRPVDFGLRAGLLEEVRSLSASDAWGRADEGLPKLWLLHRLLDLRRKRPEALAGAYRALPSGPALIAFARGDDLVVAIGTRPMRGAAVAGEPAVLQLPGGRWRDLDGTEWTGRAGLDRLLDPLGVAVLERSR